MQGQLRGHVEKRVHTYDLSRVSIHVIAAALALPRHLAAFHSRRIISSSWVYAQSISRDVRPGHSMQIQRVCVRTRAPSFVVSQSLSLPLSLSLSLSFQFGLSLSFTLSVLLIFFCQFVWALCSSLSGIPSGWSWVDAWYFDGRMDGVWFLYLIRLFAPYAFYAWI